MTDHISREAATTLFARACGECKEACEEFDGFYADCNQCLLHGVLKEFAAIPAADVVPGSDFRDCRNELCLHCGFYKHAHEGACDGCRWRDKSDAES